jgi:nitroimidazol reductase NimA-like FMN-containing flavoprotein (pyridoxamine 5'-phosphate oxidase superfamily)
VLSAAKTKALPEPGTAADENTYALRKGGVKDGAGDFQKSMDFRSLRQAKRIDYFRHCRYNTTLGRACGQAKEEQAMEGYHALRRKEKEIKDPDEMMAILAHSQFVTVAMCRGEEPYLVTLSNGYDKARNAIYFHCAREGKKIEILKANDRVWGQAIVDRGYSHGHCDHLFDSVQFAGRVRFIEDAGEKRRALEVMTRQLEREPEKVLAAQVTDESVARVCIGRIDIEFLSGKRSEKLIASL